MPRTIVQGGSTPSMSASASNPSSQSTIASTTIPAPSVSNSVGAVSYSRALTGPDGSNQSAILSSTTTASATVNYASSTVFPAGTWVSTLTIQDSSTTLTVVQTWRVGDADGFILLDASAMSKNDPSNLEIAAPSALSGNRNTFTIDADTTKLNVSEMLAYYTTIPGVTFAETTLEVSIKLTCGEESATQLIVAAFVADRFTDIGGGWGAWMALSEETSGSYDHWVRTVATAVPSVASLSATEALLDGIFTIDTGGTSHQASYRFMDGATYRSPINTFSLGGTAPSSGSIYVGFLLSTRAIRTASETLKSSLWVKARGI